MNEQQTFTVMTPAGVAWSHDALSWSQATMSCAHARDKGLPAFIVDSLTGNRIEKEIPHVAS